MTHPAPRRGRCRNPAGFRQDYGGACRIRVELTGTGGAPSVSREFKVPRDMDNDNIADCWEEAVKAEWESTFGTNIAEAATGFVGRSKPTEPRDPDGDKPLAAHCGGGDGLDAVDEYRGFSLPGTGSTGGTPHFRPSTAWKDMVFQVDVAATNGVPVVPSTAATNFAARVAGVFLRDLGIRVHWHLGQGFERESYAGRTLEEVHDAYIRGRSAGAPLLHNAKGVRRLVFTTGIPLARDGREALGISDGLCALVDVGGALGQFATDDAWHWFLARHGVLRGEAVFRLLLHETGHVAGCLGDERLLDASPAIQIRSRVGAPGECSMWTRDRLDERCLYLRHPLGTGDEAYVVLGEEPVTVAGLAARINAESLLFDASVAYPDAGGGDAARLVFNPDPKEAACFPSTGGVWRAVSPEAAVNGVMAYDKHNPAVWNAPAFDNGAAGEPSDPRARLYKIEVGAVLVTPVPE